MLNVSLLFEISFYLSIYQGPFHRDSYVSRRSRLPNPSIVISVFLKEDMDVGQNLPTSTNHGDGGFSTYIMVLFLTCFFWVFVGYEGFDQEPFARSIRKKCRIVSTVYSPLEIKKKNKKQQSELQLDVCFVLAKPDVSSDKHSVGMLLVMGS